MSFVRVAEVVHGACDLIYGLISSHGGLQLLIWNSSWSCIKSFNFCSGLHESTKSL